MSVVSYTEGSALKDVIQFKGVDPTRTANE